MASNAFNKLLTVCFSIILVSFICCGKKTDVTPNDNNGKDTTKVDPTKDDIVVADNKIFKHPGLLHTQDDFDRIKAKVNSGAEPWVSGWNKLIANSHSSSNYTMQGPTKKLIRGGNSREEPEPDNYGKAFNDVAAAYQNAIRWKVTGDVVFAKKSIQILNAWASTCDTLTGDPNKALGAGIYGYQFANAGEIMRDYTGWSAADFLQFQKWLLKVFYPISYDYLKTHYNTCDTYIYANWDLCNILTIMSIGVVTDRVDLYSYAMDQLMHEKGNGQLTKTINYIHPKSSNDDVDLGQLQESGRDQGHALLVIGFLGNLGQTANNQGDDLFGYKDNLILKGAEYEAKYNVANLSVPFTTYTSCNPETPHTIVSPDGRGEARPIWEPIYNYYVVKKGITARYVTMAANTVRPEGGGGDYGPNSGGFDQLGFGTLLFSR
jgi:hypothetical protein